MDGANQLQKGGTQFITEAAVRHAHRLLSGADDELFESAGDGDGVARRAAAASSSTAPSP